MLFFRSVLLLVIALVAGIGITTVGPGGVFVTAALYVFTDLSSASVAGTASATFVATGLVGSGAYIRSGELTSGPASEAAVVLSFVGIVGAVVGTRLNLVIGNQLFGDLLAIFLAGIGILLMYREMIGLSSQEILDTTARRRRIALAVVGGGIGILGGMLGVGGPVVAVPVLVVLGMPMLRAVAVAQVQSIFLSLFATVGYLAVGSVDVGLAILVGIPQLVGVLIGWHIAHLVPTRGLRVVLAGVLLVVSVIIAF